MHQQSREGTRNMTEFALSISSTISRRRMLGAGLLGVVAIAGGCASNKGTTPFMKRINSIRAGTPQAAVRERLGPPNTKRVGIITSPPPPGATENLPTAAPVGTAYQQWIYKRDDSHFHVFFARDRDRAGGWKVIQVRSTSANAVE